MKAGLTSCFDYLLLLTNFAYDSIDSINGEFTKKLILLLRAGERRESLLAPISRPSQKCLLISFERFLAIFWIFLTFRTLRFHDYFFCAFLAHVNHISSWNLRKQLTTFHYFFWECKLYFHGSPLTLSLSARSETEVF